MHVDAFGRVEGADGVFAVRDMTTRVVRQGGLAAQLAEAAASVVAAEAGADVTPGAVSPEAAHGRAGLPAQRGRPSAAAEREPLWWPPHKIVTRRVMASPSRAA